MHVEKINKATKEKHYMTAKKFIKHGRLGQRKPTINILAKMVDGTYWEDKEWEYSIRAN